MDAGAYVIAMEALFVSEPALVSYFKTITATLTAEGVNPRAPDVPAVLPGGGAAAAAGGN
jgi:hypothetical protein